MSYVATRNWAKAGEMALTAAANLVGCGAVVKVAVAALAAVKLAKVGAAAFAVAKTLRGAKALHVAALWLPKAKSFTESTFRVASRAGSDLRQLLSRTSSDVRFLFGHNSANLGRVW